MLEFPLPTSFHFSVTFDTESVGDDYGFQEVGGFGPEMETEAYREGGENRYAWMLPKAVKHPKLSLKRGLAPMDSTLVKWCKDVLETGLSVSIETKTVHVKLLNDEAQPLRHWTFVNAYPVHWDFESFNATKNSVAVEKIELCYDYVMRDSQEHNSAAAKEFVLPPKPGNKKDKP